MPSKRMKKANEQVDRTQAYPLLDAVRLVKANAGAKFDESVDLAVRLGVDPRHADQMVRGVVQLPNGSGKKLKIAVFAKGEQAEAAKKAGADIVGTDDLIKQIEAGKIDFDRCIATPDMMAQVAKLGKVLGPRGLMPNPRTNTVNADAAAAVEAAKSGAVEFRVEKAGIVQTGIGRASFSEQQLMENIYAVMDAIKRAKPTGAKGTYIRRISLSSTMGPGLTLAAASFSGARARVVKAA